MSRSKKVGFIGLGMMGFPMAARLAGAGIDLFVLDANHLRANEFVAAHGGRVLTADAAGTLDVLITMLPNSAIVESVLLGSGSDGWARHLPAGSTVIDMSSSEPARSRELANSLANLHLDYLDAPVSGGVKKAESGALAILVGGEQDLLDRHRDVLAAMGEKILFIGPAGAGHAAKALNNYVSATGLVATVEALRVAERFGIEPEAMADVLNASSGRTNTSETKVKQFMLSGTFGSGFALKLMAKDLNIARALAHELDFDFMLGDKSVDIWNRAAEISDNATDHTEMYRFLDGKL